MTLAHHRAWAGEAKREETVDPLDDETDIDGQARIQITQVDIGCDEVVCEGDANGDGTVDPLDSGFVLARFGCMYPDDGENCQRADVNGDGAVDPLDSGFMLARFGCPVGMGDPGCDAADPNGDGAVDPLDSGFVLARFGPCQ